jgi:4'-phosphopantetheinyl transferase
LLRRVLERYEGVSELPEGALSPARRGKPELAPGIAAPPLAFNLAHSGELALVAVTGGAAVGVDLEQLRPIQEARAIARRYFAAQELADLEPHLGSGGADEVFLRHWTLKEAYLKATGEGLARGLGSFAVRAGPDGAARLTWDAQDPGATEGWALAAFAPAAGYVAALALAAPPGTRLTVELRDPD